MSTKAIREALDLMKEIQGHSSAEIHAAALAEVDAIERAARALTTGGDMGEVTFANNLMESIAKDAK